MPRYNRNHGDRRSYVRTIYRTVPPPRTESTPELQWLADGLIVNGKAAEYGHPAHDMAAELQTTRTVTWGIPYHDALRFLATAPMPGNDFFENLRLRYRTYGDLTPNMVAALRRGREFSADGVYMAPAAPAPSLRHEAAILAAEAANVPPPPPPAAPEPVLPAPTGGWRMSVLRAIYPGDAERVAANLRERGLIVVTD
jgi:hypothetical protein